ncbi:lytic murein transglycosylase [Nocardia abscessus]|uniref:lytic murein transglycosylase n=2 Tax=Nocardia abscessus TaxID=120957 RepID=UPI001D14D3B5|nr:lytic murein transglycosylase [Nocardia abscessus]MCC3331794.1 lytic murein transglycosylase [Nocardia abscessus]
MSGSGVQSPVGAGAPQAPEVLAAASSGGSAGDAGAESAAGGQSRVAGLLPVSPELPRRLRAVSPPFAGVVPLQEVTLPAVGGALGIPEVVLAAYRNAELALGSSAPGCGLSWHLLAGIGRIESGHARGGRTDAAGTTVSPILGPALDGSLPGNEVIRAADGGYVRALGPMQFLPGTWGGYGADGNGDGVADPHNVFDAALAAGKYLCSGGVDLRDRSQELRAVLRYNNSMAYAANVLSWSAAYRSGGSPTQVRISPDLVPPGVLSPGSDMSAVRTGVPGTDPAEQARAAGQAPLPRPRPQPTQVMITIPGLPPIPCGIFCPPPPPVHPCAAQPIPAPMPQPGQAGIGRTPLAPGQPFGAAPGQLPDHDPNNPAAQANPHAAGQSELGEAGAADCSQPGSDAATGPEPGAPEQPNAPGVPEQDAAPGNPEPATATPPAPEPEPAPAPEPAPTPPPGITLPFGIVIPLPAPPPPPPAG